MEKFLRVCRALATTTYRGAVVFFLYAIASELNLTNRFVFGIGSMLFKFLGALQGT